MIKTNNLKNLKLSNKVCILSYLYYNGECSRSELAEKCALTPASITILTKELLLDEVLIPTHEVKKSTSGRKEMLLDINYNKFLAVSVSIESEITSISICSFKKVLTSISFLTSKINNDTKTLVDLIKVQMQGFQDEICTIGVAIVGKVDAQNGKVIDSYGIFSDEIELKHELSQAFDLPIHIVNNVHAQAEMLIKDENDDFLFIKNGAGIGSAVVRSSSVMFGKNFFGLGLGHIIVDVNGKTCRCGKKGCLETIINEIALVKSYNDRFGKKPNITEMISLYGDDTKIETVMTKPLISLALAISNACTTIDPQKVILSGGFFENDKFVEDLKKKMLDFGCDIKLEQSKSSENLRIMSGAIFALKKILFEV